MRPAKSRSTGPYCSITARAAVSPNALKIPTKSITGSPTATSSKSMIAGRSPTRMCSTPRSRCTSTGLELHVADEVGELPLRPRPQALRASSGSDPRVDVEPQHLVAARATRRPCPRRRAALAARSTGNECSSASMRPTTSKSRRVLGQRGAGQLLVDVERQPFHSPTVLELRAPLNSTCSRERRAADRRSRAWPRATNSFAWELHDPSTRRARTSTTPRRRRSARRTCGVEPDRRERCARVVGRHRR